MSRTTTRVLVHFSCGAASAVAAKLAIAEYGHPRVAIVNAFMADEHEDNRRFLADCEHWLEHPITVLRDEKYEASALVVWEKHRFIKSKLGAKCSKKLKWDVLDRFALPDDLHILGYTAEEEDRHERFLANNPLIAQRPILIDKNLSKADCLAMIDRAGIELPITYRLGFDNANCLNCCKGGAGYWNKIRKHFPERFAEAARIERAIGPNARILRDRRTDERIWLTELTEEMGRQYPDEPSFSCSFFCEMAEQDIRHEGADAA